MTCRSTCHGDDDDDDDDDVNDDNNDDDADTSAMKDTRGRSCHPARNFGLKWPRGSPLNRWGLTQVHSSPLQSTRQKLMAPLGSKGTNHTTPTHRNRVSPAKKA